MSEQMTGWFFDDIASNPLLEGLFAPKTRVEWAEHLRYDPRAEWGVLKSSQVVLAVNQIRRVFAPTATQAEAACALYEMLYQGLIARDPRLAVNRQRVYEHGRFKGTKLSDLPWFPTYAAGMMLRGITKQGKSHVVQRVLDAIPQTFVRPKNEECGWIELKQLVHMTVPMPSDSSRKGFLLSAFMEIDRLLGTTYATDYGGKTLSVEIQLVALLNVLGAHRCGLFVVEEAQAENLATAKFGREFVLFFLRVLNFGIPMLLIGNPRAFEEIDKNSQDLSRLSDAGSFALDPVTHHMSPMWRRDIMPHLWGWTLGIEDAPIEHVNRIVWEYTGGFPGYVARLRRETLLECRRKGLDRVEECHIHAAYRSASMTPLHPIIEAFSKKDVLALRTLKDVPVAYFERKWAAEVEAARVAAERAAALAKLSDGAEPGSAPADAGSGDPKVDADGPAGSPASAIGPDSNGGDKPKAAPRVPRKRAVKPVELSNDDLRSPASVKRLGDKLETGAAP